MAVLDENTHRNGEEDWIWCIYAEGKREKERLQEGTWVFTAGVRSSRATWLIMLMLSNWITLHAVGYFLLCSTHTVVWTIFTSSSRKVDHGSIEYSVHILIVVKRLNPHKTSILNYMFIYIWYCRHFSPLCLCSLAHVHLVRWRLTVWV